MASTSRKKAECLAATLLLASCFVGGWPLFSDAHASAASKVAVAILAVDPVVVEGANGPLVMRITAPVLGRDLPVVVFSHGAGLGRTDYRPLIEAIARAGYIVIQPDHPDSSDEGIMTRSRSADTWRQRYEALDWIGSNVSAILKQVSGLSHRADGTRLAVVGHSFGGYTAGLAMGAHVEGMPDVRDLPYQAGILLAAPGHWDGLTPDWKGRAGYLAVDWSSMKGPVLMINGTADDGGMSDQGPRWHDDAFRRTPSGSEGKSEQKICLMHIEGAGHYLGGIDSVLRSPVGDTTVARRAQVFDTVITFLDRRVKAQTDAEQNWQRSASTMQCK